MVRQAKIKGSQLRADRERPQDSRQGLASRGRLTKAKTSFMLTYGSLGLDPAAIPDDKGGKLYNRGVKIGLEFKFFGGIWLSCIAATQQERSYRLDIHSVTGFPRSGR